jgi:hypothetical protein
MCAQLSFIFSVLCVCLCVYVRLFFSLFFRLVITVHRQVSCRCLLTVIWPPPFTHDQCVWNIFPDLYPEKTKLKFHHFLLDFKGVA